MMPPKIIPIKSINILSALTFLLFKKKLFSIIATKIPAKNINGIYGSTLF